MMILSPNDIILKEIENNKKVSSFLNQIESFLKDITEFKLQYSIDIETDFILSTRELNLLKFSFNRVGWNIDINFSHNKSSKNIKYTVFLYSIEKFYI